MAEGIESHTAATARPRLLVLRRGGLGDTLLLIPALRGLAAALPGAELHLAGVSGFAEVLARYGVVHRARSSEELALHRLRAPRPTDADLAAFAGYRWILAEDEAVARALPGRAAAFDPRLGAVPREPADRQLRTRIAAAARALAIALPDDDAPPALLATRRPVASPPRAVLHPGAGSPAKCWPLACHAELAEALCAAGLGIEVLLGEAEAERMPEAQAAFPAGTRFLAGRSAADVAVALSGARVFVGHDSGPTHLAAALRVPTLALFGPTDPAIWAPRGPHVRVLRGSRADGPPDPSVAEVLAQVVDLARRV
ncbi:MAG: glycosyltransferase family 9 protein [Planctomycetes bacterium]|nr:glycosyltransferase family 9 protein [Planctomycetota bacterium]